jgi:hypothetical protein
MMQHHTPHPQLRGHDTLFSGDIIGIFRAVEVTLGLRGYDVALWP